MRLSDSTIRQTVKYIAANFARYIEAARPAGYPVEAVRIEANNAFQQITGISLLFVDHPQINNFCSDQQSQIWSLTDQYGVNDVRSS